MHRVNRNSPAPVVSKAVTAALFLLLSVFYFSPRPLQAQAFSQLAVSASGLEVPFAPAPSGAARYTAAPGFSVYFIDVGQGDAIYLELPGGKNALIDGGPSTSASSGLARFLASKKVTSIDHVMLTHPHADHYKGLHYVFSNISVSHFYDTGMDNKGAKTDDTLREKVRALGVNTVYPAPGDVLPLAEGVSARVFNSCPEAVGSTDGKAINNCSIVMKVTYQHTSVLFTGDMEADREAELVSRYGTELDSEVLKVGHHGSPNSSSERFLRMVSPKAAYIEVGRNNYGHPARAVLDRLLAAGAQVFRTDLGGTQEYSPFAALLASAGRAVSVN